ncbi:hypothetical protein SGRA_2431 [Saprospira grandis str. Lewin]|uniref:Uncharacterized protein n=1 Tax=Saprospira grandis (strain Lewin) TaxID=984262 RepID=H6L4Y4_SAPGL|nr:hypothetical protein SGRA_2431 [Saprospira grandis str. Lewin]
MRRGGRRPDRAFEQSEKAKGRADLRAPKRSARRRREAPSHPIKSVIDLIKEQGPKEP